MPSLKGPKNPNWGGGIIKFGTGYVYVKNPNHHFASPTGYIPEHRLNWEKANNACLLSEKFVVIHHKNGIRNDNRFENLEPMSRGKHTGDHQMIDMSERKCKLCDSKWTANYTHPNGLKRPNWYYYSNAFICAKCFQRKRKERIKNEMA